MYDVTELLLRLVAIENEASAALLPGLLVNAQPLWFWQGEASPYWINRIATIGDDPETTGDEGSIDAVVAEMGLIYGEPGAGFEAEIETKVNTVLPQLLVLLRQRYWLQSAGTYVAPMLYLNQCRISLASNLTEFPPTPAGARRVGILFRAVCQFIYAVEQDY